MQDFALGFNLGEIEQLYKFFDFNRNGLIEYDEFIRCVRGPMNAARQKIVLQAFAKMDKDGNGILELKDIEGVYSAEKHPDVMTGKKTES